MAHTEADSFVLKFKNLWHAGVKATLTFQSDNGEAFVTLKAGLGSLPPPPNQAGHAHVHRGYGRHRSPSYLRRQDRRRAAREAAEQNAPTQAEQVCVTENEANATIENIVEDVAHESSEIPMNDEAEEAEKRFECILCDFNSNWENGIKIHMSRKHGNIEQLDGNIEIEDENFIDEKYERTEHYWKKGWLGRFYHTFLDASKIIDECHGMPEDIKEGERKKVLEARKASLGTCYHAYPPWV